MTNQTPIEYFYSLIKEKSKATGIPLNDLVASFADEIYGIVKKHEQEIASSCGICKAVLKMGLHAGERCTLPVHAGRNFCFAHCDHNPEKIRYMSS
jgi:hypothetical protein